MFMQAMLENLHFPNEYHNRSICQSQINEIEKGGSFAENEYIHSVTFFTRKHKLGVAEMKIN